MELVTALLLGVVIGAALTASYRPYDHYPVPRQIIEQVEAQANQDGIAPTGDGAVDILEWASRKLQPKKPLPLDEQVILYRDPESGMTSMRSIKDVQDSENAKMMQMQQEETAWQDLYCDESMPPLG